MRLGTLVLNAGFYRPALLARDIATLDQLSNGRVEVGLGAGYVEQEFAAAGLDFPRPGARVDHLETTVDYLQEALSDSTHVPAPVQVPPPIMVAGIGDRVLTIAARKADVVALSWIPNEEILAERVAFVRQQAGPRFDNLELNLIIFEAAIDRDPNLVALRNFDAEATDETLRGSVNLLHGSVAEGAARLRYLRETFGVSYFTFIAPSSADLEKIGELIALLR